MLGCKHPKFEPKNDHESFNRVICILPLSKKLKYIMGLIHSKACAHTFIWYIIHTFENMLVDTGESWTWPIFNFWLDLSILYLWEKSYKNLNFLFWMDAFGSKTKFQWSSGATPCPDYEYLRVARVGDNTGQWFYEVKLW